MRGFSRSMNIKNLYVITMCGILLIYLMKKQRNQDATKCLSFEEMVAEKVNMEDECLVNYVKNRRMCYPSTLQYNLTTRIDKKIGYVTPLTPLQSYLSEKDAPWIEALIAVETFVPKRGQRHFLECGAIDGVTFSTTLHLERFLNWTGILIEADDRFYSDLKRVHRRAYGVHACVSRDSYPSVALFKPSPIYVASTFLGHNVTKVNPGTGYLVSQHRRELNGSDVDFIEVKCIPIYTALLAANITNIDLFVLDIEGVELEVLKTLPFEKVSVAIFMIEMAGKPESERKLLRIFLQSKGYIFYDSINGGMHPGDEIFIKDEYYKGEEDIEKLKILTPRDTFKIVTGSKDEDVDSNDLKSFVIASHPVFGHLVI
ncbi:uncharacterized protein LOC136032834 [Artemia franciscana]|uniref:Methyltransferase FkbM domain-containing protein n=1 Tax=Artemia franciscana TaxID=6661 RepID=A0AA88IAI3_ARTSF|nr:hypothetical protein QYM36_001277 [Artemia franciscana]